MRLFDVIREDIPRPPRNLRLFVANRVKELRDMKALSARLKDLNLDNREAVSSVGDALRDLSYSEDLDLTDAFDEFDHMVRWGKLDKLIDDYAYTLEWTDQLFKSEPDESEIDRAKKSDYIKKNMERLVYWIDRFKEQFGEEPRDLEQLSAAVDHVEDYLRENDYFNPEYYAPEDIQSTKDWVEALRLAANLGTSLARLYAAGDKFAEMRRWWEAHAWGSQPKPREVETLYHVTAFADEIAREGFRPVKPSSEERHGLGSFGAGVGSPIDTHISFTHDLHYARQLLRSMRELTMIANGQIRKHQLLRWFADEGIDLNRIIFNLRGIPTDSHGRPQLSRYPDTPEANAELYKGWLYLNEIGRENPVFINIERTVDALKGRSPRDVGIIQSQVRMDDPSIEYLRAEYEWRVPPSAVLSAERVQ